MTDVRQYGELGAQLLLEARRSTQSDTLFKYNDSLVRSIIREQRDLEKSLLAHIHHPTDHEPDDAQPPPPALMIIQTAINRNKRCLLAYHAHRLDRLRDLYWAYGGAIRFILNRDSLRDKLSPQEVDYLRSYHVSATEFRGEFFSNELDVMAGVEAPPRTLTVQVKVVKDCGVIQTEYGAIDFKKGHRHVVRKADIEHLILQGYLEEVGGGFG